MGTENESRGRTFIEQARRAQIIAAATDTVAEIGYANASLSQIAARAKVSKSVISYHFEGKDELLKELVTQFFTDTWAYMEERILAEPTATGQVRAWVGSQLAYFGAHRNGFLAMADIVSNHREPDGSRPFAEASREEVDGMAEIIKAGVESGEFRVVDPHSVASIIILCAEGLLGGWAWGESFDLDAQTEVLLDFIDHALRKEHP
ncbi:TetR/AcrR family transcriptional regulator [Natronoglycomyces albus]|uniref:TetR/AcrR family transcriptional regulator n=1 Tax=Natronoglycomyces albus TaxID=2811108 RepID=A0A895XG90_9ACTN|nr:TetR/AcrR family transcriptional regulator [Natronoglycomyces albus]QSB04354.1 TetR/AcrR family transcriptional regulator [Natronoglycomyces albus]